MVRQDVHGPGRSAVRGLWMTTPVLLALSGCGLSNSRRYDGMLRAYHAEDSPSRGGGEDALEARNSRRTGKAAQHDAGDPIAAGEGGRLDRQSLVRAVLARNPSIEAARASWRAALARYPQETAIDDPMLSYSFAPLSIAGDASFGQVIQLSQNLPFPGKRGLRGDVALAEAEAAKGDLETTRLHLALMASKLFDDYYVVARALEINAEHGRLLSDLKKSAEAQYTAGRASQQDPLQAENEIAHLQHEGVVLESERDVVVAQLNGLLHRAPHLPLPPPPAELPTAESPEASVASLEKRALERRPEVEVERARIRAAEARIASAEREYFPDFGLMASYNSMWAMPEHQWMLGASVEIPIQRSRRAAAVDEAEAHLAAARSALARRADEVRVEVASARRRVLEARHVVRLHRDRLLPVARAQVEAARAGFIAGTNDFSTLVQAEKNLRSVELRHRMAQAELFRRLADLSRAIGVPPGISDRAEGSAR